MLHNMWHDMVPVHDIYDTSSDKQVPVSWQHPQHYGKVQNSSVWVHLFVSLWNKANQHSVNIKRTTGITKGLLINASSLSLSLQKGGQWNALEMRRSRVLLLFAVQLKDAIFFVALSLTWKSCWIRSHSRNLFSVGHHPTCSQKTSKTWRSKTRYRATAFSKNGIWSLPQFIVI